MANIVRLSNIIRKNGTTALTNIGILIPETLDPTNKFTPRWRSYKTNRQSNNHNYSRQDPSLIQLLSENKHQLLGVLLVNRFTYFYKQE